MNTLLLPPPYLHLRLSPLHFSPPPPFLRHRHHILLSASSQHLNLTTINGDEQDPYDVACLPNPHYDFAPLLNFLSTNYSPSHPSQPDPPTRLDPAELRLAESYRAVPAPLWHSLIKNLSSSPSSFSTAYSLVTWLQRHNLCFSYELLYSILIHALGRNEKLYEAFLLSQRQSLTPLTYNALIGACARNDDLEKALNLMERMRRDGYQSDFVNYSLIIQSLMRNNSVDVAILEKLYGEMEADNIELDGQLLNDIIAGFAKAGDIDRAMYFLGVMQGNGLSPKTSTVVAVVNELGNLGRVEEAEAVFVELKEGGLRPRTRAYNALLKGM
ncbi:UNVERIFIED_CONTAM: Pentatricopeptide repeat-containing protein, chloroplastic [Sesamum radiatum]|uniref:Pentatricopeptide repeat-containing protein, chloroplastic n=1 Tax=Sesamum radiatum TaxID=300843 RepID=A0AAW2PY60_SESRA